MMNPLRTVCVVLALAAPVLAAEKTPDPKVARFDGLLQKVQADPGGAKEAEVRELLDLSRELGRPYSASLAIRNFLSHHFQPSPGLLLATADAACHAGDYTYAVTRYKAYLAAASPSPEAARAAATLYTLLIDFLGAEDDAYQFLAQHGERFRSEPAARRFDSWFLTRAQAQDDCAHAARILAAALADKMPLPQERLYYWGHLDWLMRKVADASQARFPALPYCRRIVPLIRDDKPRAAQYGFLVANLAFHAGAAGKDDDALARDFELVALAARDYLEAAPAAATLKEIVEVLAGGPGRFDGAAWGRQKEQKQALFEAAFDRLNDADRQEMMAWDDGRRAADLASPQQWAQLGAKHAKLFSRSPAARFVPLPTSLPKRDDYRKLATFCKDIAGEDAAVIDALAADDDLTKAVDHLMRNHAWHLEADRYNRLLWDKLFPAWRTLAESAGRKEGLDEAVEQAMLHFGTRYLAQSPIAVYDPEAVKSYLRAAWKLGGKDAYDKSQVAPCLLALTWVPFENIRNRRGGRGDVFAGIANDVRQWSDWARREAAKKKDKHPDADAAVSQIAPLQDALQQARAEPDPAKAPDELCKAVAQAVLAAWDQKDDERLQAERRIYALVKDYPRARTAYGRDAFRRITSSSGRGWANFEFQLEMLDDQLAGYQGGEPGEPAQRLYEAIYSYRNDWRPRETQVKNQDRSLQVSAVVAKAVLRLADKGQFSPRLFDWFRDSRVGRNWNGGEAGQDVLAKVIEKRLFEKAGYRAHESCQSATTSYMRLVRYEFPALARRFPVETHFDDRFVEEAAATGFLDWSYWEFGRDEGRKVAGAAAAILAREPLAVGGQEREGAYSLRTLNRWLTVAMKADKPAREAMLKACEDGYGKTRFDAFAMGYGRLGAEAEGDKPADRKAFFERLGTYIARSAQAPARVSMPALPQLKALAAKDLAEAELDVLARMFTEAASPQWPKDCGYDAAARLLYAGLAARGRQAELLALAGHFWKVARDARDYAVWKDMTALADELRKANLRDLALAYSSVALTVMKGDLPTDLRTAIGAVRSWALSEMGGIIPVAKGHPLRALYEAQLAYLTGRQQTAWETYLAHRARLSRSFKEFDPQFCIWIIDKNTELRQFDEAERLARELIAWFDEAPERFDPEVRARLQLSYANIALAREDRPRARALYERIVAAREFAGTRAQLDAELRIADVDTLDGNFDRAVERLESLARRKDRYLQGEAAYHMALVRFAQEEYAEAKEQLDEVFRLAPDHAEGRILEGKVNLKLKKLEQPTEIDLGERIGRKYIVPGRPVRVSLVDQNLALVRKATEIEIRAWTDAGDEEFLLLTPFGESKTKFKGQLPTELGEVSKGDHVLQVIGSDRVHYAFSDDFAKRQRIEENAPFTLLVATDAELYVSSGRILTREQREAQALEEMIRRRLGPAAGGPDKAVPLSTVRAEDQVKPGNPINVRVADGDRGETRGPDTITVRIATTSGDSIEAFTLTETGPYSGVFEGAVPTEPAQAAAYASDSQEGAEPSFAISAGDYPAWVGLPRPFRSRPKTFSVDLNDNVSLGKMSIAAGQQGRRLKSFLVQTSFNAQDFTTVGAWPARFVPWSGQGTLELARYVSEEEEGPKRAQLAGPKTVREFLGYFEQGALRNGLKTVTARIAVPAANWDYRLDGHGKDLDLDSNKASHKFYVARMKLAFYQPRRQVRTFTLAPRAEPSKEFPLTYVLAVDGQGAGQLRRRQEGDQAIELKQALGKGVHTLEVFIFAHQHANPSFEVLCDSDQPPYEVPCPAEMFDPAKHPEIAQGLAREVAEVTADPDGTRFDVAFPAAARARVVRLLLTDFESDAPAIQKISLTDAAGSQVLPTRHDFMELRKNGVLEIVPGDRITVSYEDSKALTAGREHHEAFLTATYTNAALSACFVEYSTKGQGQGQGQREARFVPMRRFQAGDKINVFIHDPDCDVSDKPDTVKFTARTSDGQPVELEALETEEHSGVFLGGVFPIRGQPQRPSELPVKEGDDVVLAYLDRENTDPGIPWTRTFAVEQVWFEPPEVRCYEVASLTLEEADRLAGRKAGPPAKGAAKPAKPAGLDGPAATRGEVVPVRRTLLAVRPDEPAPDKPTPLVLGGPLLVEVLFPFITKSPESPCTIYVQTSSGRKKAAKPLAPDQFDPNVPGTLRLTRTPGDVSRVETPPGYREVVVRGNPYALAPLDDGRFTFSVPMRLGSVPDKTLVGAEEAAAMKPAGTDPDLAAEPDELALSVRGEDEIFVGIRYQDQAGKDRWVVRRAALRGDFFLDVMDRRYQEKADGLYVGQTLYLRVIDPTRDATDDKDVIQVELTTKSGRQGKLELVETYSHSGVFKGLAKVVHADDQAAAAEAGAVPAVYGDVLTARYAQPRTQAAEELAVNVFKGADGQVLPFTKRFQDPAVAVETQFMIAEAYFELAKRHRQLAQENLARREIAQGRKLLEEAIRDYPHTAARAQAEYLLADLSLEFANDAVNEEERKKHYADAITRFSDIVATWPESEYAPKAQFRKALAYEKMEMLDEACEEYVKLSYRYPDNPLVAETIARLGQYFMNKGRTLRAEGDQAADPVEKEKARLKAVEMFKTAGEVFARLSARFPSHNLAGKTLLLSAQCFMQAEDYSAAVKGYLRVAETPDMDKDLVAEAMYWCGHSYMETNVLDKAYQMFKKLEWDYPAGKWAKFARGRLADEKLLPFKE